MKEEELPDISLQEAMNEVNKARALANYKRKLKEFNKALDEPRQTVRWEKTYKWILKYNPYAREAFRLFDADCKKIKEESKADGKGRYIRHALHMPQMLWDALALTDPEIKNIDKLDKEGQVKLIHKLGRTFPIYWIPTR